MKLWWFRERKGEISERVRSWRTEEVCHSKDLDENEKTREYVRRMTEISKRLGSDYEIDPTTFPVFTRDLMKVEVGLII